MTVVDASVWVSRLVPQDLNHQASRKWLERHVAAGGLVVAPALLLPEVAGAISRRTGQPLLAHRAVAAIQRLAAVRLIPVDGQLATLAAQVVADHGLRGADALYVAVAQRLGLPLVTWDAEQTARAKGVVAVSDPRQA